MNRIFFLLRYASCFFLACLLRAEDESKQVSHRNPFERARSSAQKKECVQPVESQYAHLVTCTSDTALFADQDGHLRTVHIAINKEKNDK